MRSSAVARTRSLRSIGGAIRDAPARERQQVAHDLTRAHRFLAHELEVGLVDAVGLVEHELGAADDRLERVVDLVRDAGNQLADRREPLAVHELVAQRQVFGHVALDADEMREAAALVPNRGDRARGRERRPVLSPALEGAAPDALRPHLGGNVALQVIHPGLDEIDELPRRELVARIAERTQKRRVRVLERPVRPRDQDQVTSVLRSGGQQLQPRVGALQLGPLRREPQRHDPQPDDGRQAGQKQPDRVDRIPTGLEIEDGVADERNEERGHHQQAHRQSLVLILALGDTRRRRRRLGGRPRVAQPRCDPGKIVEGPDLIVASRNRLAGADAQHEADADTDGEPQIRQAPVGATREPHRGRHAGEQQQAVPLDEGQKACLRRRHGLGQEARHEDKVRIEEDREQPVGADRHRRRSDEPGAGAAMRPRQQRDERTDTAADAENGVPLQPGVIGDPADVADDPERHRHTDDVPEKPLGTGPLPAAPEDDDRHQGSRSNQADVAEDRQRERARLRRPAGHAVGQKERQPERQIPETCSQGQAPRVIFAEISTVTRGSGLGIRGSGLGEASDLKGSICNLSALRAPSPEARAPSTARRR